MSMKVSIIDYGMGNLWSVCSALSYLGYKYELCSTPLAISKANVLILPGVGSFNKAMQSIVENKLDEAILETVQVKQKKILGICLGMQLLAQSSTEDGITQGLNLIPGEVIRFQDSYDNSLKIPHIGFNEVVSDSDSKLFKGIKKNSDFYFVHSYMIPHDNFDGNIAVCNYGRPFLATYEKDNIFAAQFHPEKSQTNGLMLLSNFLTC